MKFFPKHEINNKYRGEMLIVDSHCHLDALNYENLHHDIADVVSKAKIRGVQYMLAVGVTLKRYQQAYASLAPFAEIFLSCGVHPLDLAEEQFNGDLLRQLAQDPKVIALGEMGLDYYYSEENKHLQQDIFSQQINIAKELKKPVIIHTRQARADTVNILKSQGAQSCGGVIHCFTEDYNMAKAVLDLGLYISISGIVTFKNAEELREVVRKLPVDRLLVETDSPYLAPVPYRSKENQPAYVREVCEYVATLKGLSLEKFAEITTDNFQRLFKVKLN